MTDVDEFDLESRTADDGGARLGRRPRRAIGSGPWLWAVVAVGLVVGGASTAEPQVLGGGPGIPLGVLDLPLDEQPAVAWEASIGATQAVVEGDRVLISDTESPVGAVFGLDLVTGEQVWQHADPNGTCHLSVPVMCVTDPATDEAALVSIDPVDGSLTTAPHPGAIAAIAAGDAVVVVETGAGDLEEVLLLEPDGTQRWRVERDVAQVAEQWFFVSLRIARDTVVFDHKAAGLDLATGEPSSHLWVPYGHDTWADVDYNRRQRVVTSPDGEVTIGLDEFTLSTDDDAGGPVVLRIAPSGLSGVEAVVRGTERVIWSLHDGTCQPQARLQHRIVMVCLGSHGMRTLAVDEVTGETQWEGGSWGSVVSASQDTVLLSDAATSVVAIDPVDGEEQWRLPLAGLYPVALADPDGGLLLYGFGSVSRLVWP